MIPGWVHRQTTLERMLKKSPILGHSQLSSLSWKLACESFLSVYPVSTYYAVRENVIHPELGFE